MAHQHAGFKIVSNCLATTQPSIVLNGYDQVIQYIYFLYGFKEFSR